MHVKRNTNSTVHGVIREAVTHDVDLLRSEDILSNIYAIVCRELYVPI